MFVIVGLIKFYAKLSLNNFIVVVNCFIVPLLMNRSNNSCFVSLNKSLHKHGITGVSVWYLGLTPLAIDKHTSIQAWL